MARSSGSTSEAKPAARSDAYTGLLLIALLAQIAAVAFFFMDWSQYPSNKKPSAPPKQGAITAPAGGGGQQGGQQAGGQQGGGQQAGGQQGGKGP